jgi:hypothetical protein
VQLRRALELAPAQRVLELPDVARDRGGVEPQVDGSDEQVIALERAARVVERLRQRVPRAVRLGLAPEQSEQAVAAHPLVTRRGEDREDRQQAALRRRPGERGAVLVVDVDASEGPKPQHAGDLIDVMSPV